MTDPRPDFIDWLIFLGCMLMCGFSLFVSIGEIKKLQTAIGILNAKIEMLEKLK